MSTRICPACGRAPDLSNPCRLCGKPDLARAMDEAFNGARRLRSGQAAILEAGIVALVDAGVPLAEIEVVHETYSDPSEEGYIIHQRAYVRRSAPKGP